LLPVLDIEEVMSDPQIQELGTFISGESPTEGEVWGIHPPLLFDGERLGRVSAPPTLGEHTKEVIDEFGAGRWCNSRRQVSSLNRRCTVGPIAASAIAISHRNTPIAYDNRCSTEVP